MTNFSMLLIVLF
uniref:Uncharacterized protein n=1 Tax=Rhizophora mucronata TaxID=61149 RepID=A0A2P2Q7H1_RHIMU